ncbi:SDR family NAD(P)-dependent oxidoreductase [Streptomyces shenzhenensis]|uniref:SDR family NAD(P)-dependent oxidoreductase n=1 Tax=Streptomyces shenzhenensis TaxID=943815 RepID=UPI0037F534D2
MPDQNHSTDLADVTAVVTGAGNGIGVGIATVLAEHGATVAVTDLAETAAEETAGLIRDAGGRAMALRHDVCDNASGEHVLRQVVDTYGRVDLLVNNAGVARQTPFDRIGEAEWDLIQNVNVRGLFFTSQLFARYFTERGSGRIVNIASYAGKEPIVEYAHYNASKAAAISLTQTLALELAPHNVTVNAVCPGVVRTKLWESLPEAQWKKQTARIPLGRGQTPEDIGEAVAFLASDRARNITGMSLGVTGGLSVW